VQTCIWPSSCHCHSLSLASVKSRLVLPFWYRLTQGVPEKGPLNGCVCVCTCVRTCVGVGVCVWNVHEHSQTVHVDVNAQLHRSIRRYCWFCCSKVRLLCVLKGVDYLLSGCLLQLAVGAASWHFTGAYFCSSDNTKMSHWHFWVKNGESRAEMQLSKSVHSCSEYSGTLFDS